MPIMEKAIKLLSLVDKHNFIDVFLVVKKPTKDTYTIESIAFLTLEEAQSHCDYLNKTYSTNVYRVYRTGAHV